MRTLTAPESQLSPHRSYRCQTLLRNDPRNCLGSLFEAPIQLPRGTAEDALLAWLVTLPDGVDPARAASELGTVAPFATPDEAEGGETGRLRALLAEIARHPAGRLPPATRRRRQPFCA
jgi:hypothetical protein